MTGRTRPRLRRGVKPAVAVAVLAVVMAVGVVTLVAARTSSPPIATPDSTTTSTLGRRQKAEQQAAQAWLQQLTGALTQLTNDVPDLVNGAREWLAGTRPDDTFRGQLDLYLRDFVEVRDKLGRLEPFEKARQSQGLYLHSMEMYVEVARIYSALLGVPAGDMRNQLDLLARRVRELGDRVYDRGQEAMKPFLHEEPLKDVEVRLPEEVPMWVAEGLAPGPPLADPPPPAAEVPPNRQASRPQQAAGTWRKAVLATDIPAAADLAAAIDGSDAGQLRSLGDRFVAAAEALRPVPDPRGGREESAGLRLSLLIDAESARLAQAVTMLDAPDLSERLRQVARRLAVVGEELWPRDVSVRQSKLDRGLLTQSGP